MQSKIYAVDFDGTLCENIRPNIGEPKNAVNDNLKSHKELFGGNSRKILADYYIDDKAVCPNFLYFYT